VSASFPLALLGLEGLWGMIGVEEIGEIRRQRCDATII
jgi:hypothetical protein